MPGVGALEVLKHCGELGAPVLLEVGLSGRELGLAQSLADHLQKHHVTAALTASFLGAAAIREHGGLSAWSVVALVVLIITGGLCLYVLWPRELRFAFDARQTQGAVLTLGLQTVFWALALAIPGGRRTPPEAQAHRRATHAA